MSKHGNLPQVQRFYEIQREETRRRKAFDVAVFELLKFQGNLKPFGTNCCFIIVIDAAVAAKSQRNVRESKENEMWKLMPFGDNNVTECLMGVIGGTYNNKTNWRGEWLCDDDAAAVEEEIPFRHVGASLAVTERIRCWALQKIYTFRIEISDRQCVCFAE